MSSNSGNKSSLPVDLAPASARLVANRAGVSVMTVSRALRGMPNVSAATRARILAAAEELGYSPSLTARSLRTGKVQVVGLVSPGADALRGGFNSDMLAGLDSAMFEDEYHVLLVLAPSLEQLVPRTIQVTRENRVGGLVVLGSILRTVDLEALGRLPIPVVLLNYSDQRDIPSGVSTVCYDNSSGMGHVVRHLVALGHRRIAYIGGSIGDHDAEEREEGFRVAMAELNLEVPAKWIRQGDFARAVEVGSLEADYLLAEGANGPTAIACASDNTAAGVMMAARRAGRDIPAKLSVTGFDDELHSSFSKPPLTTAIHPGYELGRLAGDLILRRLKDNSTQAERLRLPISLRVRDSTGPPP
ncbi:MAG: LacI family DNA-binding transcriptional regulator [Candidatus Sumerlaeia bacterium]|nr:LacI family DNA-binding transcriptional regulator [Candidatus Sumerlaeia bacterium]